MKSRFGTIITLSLDRPLRWSDRVIGFLMDNDSDLLVYHPWSLDGLILSENP